MDVATQNIAISKDWRLWLRSQQWRQDMVGEFARDYLRSRRCRRFRTLSGLDRHLVDEHLALWTTLRSRDWAWREYQVALH